jgi:hypothetical protein
MNKRLHEVITESLKTHGPQTAYELEVSTGISIKSVRDALNFATRKGIVQTFRGQVKYSVHQELKTKKKNLTYYRIANETRLPAVFKHPAPPAKTKRERFIPATLEDEQFKTLFLAFNIANEYWRES